MSQQLSIEQQRILQVFQEVSQISDDYLSIQILQQNNWNLDLSLSQFVGDNNIGQRNVSSIENASRRQTSSSSEVENPRNSQRNNHTSSSNGNLTGNENENDNSIFKLIILTVKWFFQTRPVSLNPRRDTMKFIDDYNLNYRRIHPTFHPDSYQSAVALAFSSSKFLLIYLHSPMHDDTNRFCRQVFGSQQLTTLADQFMITWGGKIWDPEAYDLSCQLKATSYPFIALLVCQNDRMVQVAEKIQGYVDEVELCTRLQNIMNTFNSLMAANRAEAERRAEAVRLREQQDREYQESAVADRQAEERQRQEEFERERREEEQKQQEELAQAVELSKQLSHADSIRKKRESLVEPAALPDVATIRFQLPKGTKLSRRFHKTDTAQSIMDFLAVHFFDNGNEVQNFTVSTHFPKMEINDMTRTVDDLSLYPRGMLYVQDLDA